MSDVPPTTFRGVRSFVPWKGGTILKWAFPTLVVGEEALTIESGSNKWEVQKTEIQGIVADHKALLIKKVDGTAGRFKTSKRTLEAILVCLQERGVSFTRSETSTYWMVSGSQRQT